MYIVTNKVNHVLDFDVKLGLGNHNWYWISSHQHIQWKEKKKWSRLSWRFHLSQKCWIWVWLWAKNYQQHQIDRHRITWDFWQCVHVCINHQAICCQRCLGECRCIKICILLILFHVLDCWRIDFHVHYELFLITLVINGEKRSKSFGRKICSQLKILGNYLWFQMLNVEEWKPENQWVIKQYFTTSGAKTGQNCSIYKFWAVVLVTS